MSKKTGAAKKTKPVVATLARPALEKGEEYIGAIIGADGKGHHIILLPGDELGTHADMLAWAKKQGGDLPDRVEQALLFRDHRSKFQRDWYWSGKQLAGDESYAWCQLFTDGYQDWNHVSDLCRARAVRRVPIQ